MALDVKTFLIGYPEFRATQVDEIQAKINAAMRQVDPDVWGVKTDDGVGLLTAHLLALSPAGQNARLVIPATRNGRTEPTTTYWTHYTKMRTQVAIGPRVA